MEEKGDGIEQHDFKGEEDKEGCSVIVVAIADFAAGDETQLSFSEGDELIILSKESTDWWWGELDRKCGYIPVSYVTSAADYARNFTTYHEWQDDEYFSDYGKLKIHLEMLCDEPRTLAYKRAINKHRDVFLGKTILDVGCGTGILSLFCARDGQANKVYAVDASVDMGNLTTEIIRANNFDHVISVFVGKIEDVELPEKVDIILSEWMGTFLVFEFMIDSVLFARDKWLKPQGIIWPSLAKLFIAPCSAKKVYDEKVTVWNDQYGFDFSPVLVRAKEEFLDRPLHNYDLDREDCLSQGVVLLHIDMQTFPRESLEFMLEQFEFIITKDGTLHGLCTWFSVLFGGVPVTDELAYETLSTGPDDETTHWKQNLFLLDEPVFVHIGNFITGSAALKRNPKYRRHLSVTFDFKIFSAKSNGSVVCNIKKKFLIWR
ncbi:protein arginine N-methyltransferase 2-like [Montipora capricornis]|uniref:protein arginine N-methyltransferase 2-like n=1 Tax=Montipora foliosa TaxID=591990 RepID=UPI0035F12BDE